MVWIKSRLSTTEHILQDSVRGANVFTSIGTGAEGATGGGWVKNMNENGFITDVNGPINTKGASYVAWCWKAGGSAVTNNDGSIASQVSVNTEAGFSITGWTGTGSNATVGHGLGSAPEFIITKQRSTAGHHWRTYHKTVGATKSLYFDLNNAQSGTDAGFMNNTEPTSTVFSIGTDTNLNENGQTHIAYCWHSVPGYSKICSYVGNGNADGPFVHLGFRPAWVMIKCSSGTFNWMIYDSERATENQIEKYVMANSNNAEAGSSTDNPIDFLSNGFKLRYTNTSTNQSGGTYVYMACEEQSGSTAYDTETNAR